MVVFIYSKSVDKRHTPWSDLCKCATDAIMSGSSAVIAELLRDRKLNKCTIYSFMSYRKCSEQKLCWGREKAQWDYCHSTTEIPPDRLCERVNTDASSLPPSRKCSVFASRNYASRGAPCKALNETLAPHLKNKTAFRKDRRLPGKSYHAQISQFSKLWPRPSLKQSSGVRRVLTLPDACVCFACVLLLLWHYQCVKGKLKDSGLW